MKINYLATFFGSLIILFAACTKITSTDIGTDLIPAVDGVNTKDTTITVYADNAGIDTISPTLAQTHVVGNLSDPLFGTTNARINFQLSLPNTNLTFEKGTLFLDSVVLVLSYNGTWGDTTKPVTLLVNELDNSQDFKPDTTAGQLDAYTGYSGTYNNTVNFTAGSSLNNQFAAPAYPTTFDDSFHAFQDSGSNAIRIRLNDAFGQRLLQYDTLTAYKNDSTFHNYVKGLQVFADPNTFNNALLKVGLTGTNTKLALYYHYNPQDSAATVMDTTVKYFTVTGDCAHSNYIVRDRSQGEVNAYLPPNNNPADTSDDVVYVQAGPGTFANIKIDSMALAKLPNYIIHRAELLMEQAADPVSDQYYTPPNLFLLAKNDTTRFVIPGTDTSNVATADAVFSSSYLTNYSDFGGIPKLNTSNNSLYAFDVTRYVQGIVTHHNNQHPFVLYAPYNEPFQLYQSFPYTSARGYVNSTPVNDAACGRVRLHGGDSDTNNTHRMRLHIVYSIPH